MGILSQLWKSIAPLHMWIHSVFSRKFWILSGYSTGTINWHVQTEFIIFPSNPNLFFLPARKSPKPGAILHASLSHVSILSAMKSYLFYLINTTLIPPSLYPRSLSHVSGPRSVHPSKQLHHTLPATPSTPAPRLSLLQANLFFTTCTSYFIVSEHQIYPSLPCLEVLELNLINISFARGHSVRSCL